MQLVGGVLIELGMHGMSRFVGTVTGAESMEQRPCFHEGGQLG